MHTEQQAQEALRSRVKKFPASVVILGSGWNQILTKVKVEIEIPFEELFGVRATVPGHDGKLVIAKVGSKRVAFMAGRFHMYEGFSAHEATLPIRVLAEAGMKQLVVTAACGALNEKYQVGDFVVLSDLITLLLALDNPVIGAKFTDVSQIFDADLRQKAIAIAAKFGIPFHEGVYCYYHGPNYETPADKMALKILGGDVVGMSTVPETLMAKSLGIKVLGLGFVTNLAFVKHDHKEVVEQANKAGKSMTVLLTQLIQASNLKT